MKDKVQNCLEENGILISNTGELENVDSISFISAIVSLEEEFDIEFPDEYLVQNNMANIDDVCRIVNQLVENKDD